LVELFEKGDIPRALAATVLIPSGMPSSKWTFSNRLISFAQTLEIDCRGYRQWQHVKRQVKTGAKAAYILRPHTMKVKDEKTGEEKYVVVGFGCLPVFPYSLTEGEPLPELIPPEPPPLLDVAERLGVKVDYQAFNGMFRGAFVPDASSITLCTHDEQTFFHELAHAAHARVLDGKLKASQDALQEIVAEVSGCVLARIYGRKQADEGRSFQYVSKYAEEMKKDVSAAIVSVLSDVEKVLSLIIGTVEKSVEEVVINAEEAVSV
jgi:hypothetical protein